MAEFFTSVWKPVLAAVVMYVCGCVFALPKGNESSSMLTMLPRPLAVILFLPIYIFGAVEFYVFGVVWQIGCFLFAVLIGVFVLLSSFGIVLSESVLTYVSAGLILSILLWSIAWMLIKHKKERSAAPRPHRRTRRR